VRQPDTKKASIKAADLMNSTMPECAAHTNVQRALHALILEDKTSAVGYLRRALNHLERETSSISKAGKRCKIFNEGGQTTWM
jgi:hypothetical protein